jgi:hypothetical protein
MTHGEVTTAQLASSSTVCRQSFRPKADVLGIRGNVDREFSRSTLCRKSAECRQVLQSLPHFGEIAPF